MKKFILSALQGSGTEISSKRLIMFLLFTIFTSQFVMWYGWHIPPNETLNTQLFTFLLATLGTVFGEPWIMDAIKLNAQKKVDDSRKEL